MLGERLLGIGAPLAVAAAAFQTAAHLPLLLLTGALLWLVAERMWEPAGRMVRVGLLPILAAVGLTAAVVDALIRYRPLPAPR